MKDLNKISGYLEKNPELADCVKTFTYSEINEFVEAFKALEQENSKLRQERVGLARECNAFEAKLAEYEKQEPVGKFAFEPLAERYHHIKHGEAQHMEPKLPLVKLFTRPAPAVSLLDLVPSESPPGEIMMLKSNSIDASCKRGGVINGWAACRAAILRNIEEVR